MRACNKQLDDYAGRVWGSRLCIERKVKKYIEKDTHWEVDT